MNFEEMILQIYLSKVWLAFLMLGATSNFDQNQMTTLHFNSSMETSVLNALPDEPVIDQKSHNSLTRAEIKEGWQLLFDGKTTKGWHNYNKATIGTSWTVNDGTLMLDSRESPEGHWQAADGGDILTEESYENFEFIIEWKIMPCGNSGIIFNVVEDEKYIYPWQTGPEMQILDNTCHPDAKFGSHRAGDLYDMIACSEITVRPAGEWNKVRLIKNNGKVEHWLNDVKVVAYEMYTDEWFEMIGQSKFKDMEDFGRAAAGKISLQDHGDKVWFRNIKIRRL
jgi:cytochrome c